MKIYTAITKFKAIKMDNHLRNATAVVLSWSEWKKKICGLIKTKEEQTMNWINFEEEKPKHGQLCIVSAGPNNHAQILAVRWDSNEEEFYWADEGLGVGPYPTEVTNMWMPFPSDPE